MAKYIFLIQINATNGQEDALNEWLDKHHLPEVLQTEGFKAVHRFVVADEDAASPMATHRYIHFYEVETDDLARTKAAMAASNDSRTPLSPALDLTTMKAVFYKAL